jgi:hypothetical protein
METLGPTTILREAATAVATARTLAEVKGEKFGDGGFTVRSRR